MKHISLLILFCLCGLIKTQGQTHVILDPKVFVHRNKINNLLDTELSLRKRQIRLIKDLKREEDTYENKRKPLTNISNVAIITTTRSMISALKDKIGRVEYNINTHKLTTLGIRHGLSRYESGLKKEKKYFEKLENEFNILFSGIRYSGGTGYTYTAFLKLLKRTMHIKNNILEIDKNVKNLMTVSRILAR